MPGAEPGSDGNAGVIISPSIDATIADQELSLLVNFFLQKIYVLFRAKRVLGQ